MDPFAGDADIGVVGSLFADPGRCRMLLARNDGRALPASRLAAEAGITPATASSHLGKLLAAGLLVVEQHGRHRYYALAGAHVGQLLELLIGLSPAQPVRSLRHGTRARALREARTCYDHLAGRLGVAVMAGMLDAGHLSGGDGRHHPDRCGPDRRVGYGNDVDYGLTGSGHALLVDLGVTLAPSGPAVRYCVDWSEQRHHLAGAVERGLLARLVELEWLRRLPEHRGVRLTDRGRDGLQSMLGLHHEEGDPAAGRGIRR